MIKRESLLLYAVTDRTWLGDNEPLSGAVKKALEGGVTLLQLREKNMSKEELIRSACEIKEICRSFGVPLIINDSADVCLASGADGVHLGQNDMPLKEARRLLGPDKIIGITAKTVEQAIAAEKGGADYIGSGAIFGTSTKSDAKKLEPETLKAITSAISIPVVAIGGINAENAPRLEGLGISGAAVVSGIFAAHDIRKETVRLKEIIKTIVHRKTERDTA